jgi:hypothetical protein
MSEDRPSASILCSELDVILLRASTDLEMGISICAGYLTHAGPSLTPPSLFSPTVTQLVQDD